MMIAGFDPQYLALYVESMVYPITPNHLLKVFWIKSLILVEKEEELNPLYSY
jgi:hypothetical protein